MKAVVFTLGCKMNEVESASLMRGLSDLGWEVSETPCAADLYILNTCAVTAEAERKSRQAVARLRAFNPDAPVLVCGCASEHSPDDFLSREGVTVVGGTGRKDKILELVGKTGFYREEERSFCELPFPKSDKTRAFLRIQDGCNRFCSYCLIPYLRGRTRSRAPESVVREARESPAREVVLTGIDISSYQSGDTDLSGLVRLLGKIRGKRFRLGSLEPCAVTPEFLSAMREAGNFAPHFHLSLQSGNSRVLRAMNRHYTREEYLERCALVYEEFADAAITTDIIVGFPGETEEEFLDSLSIVGEAGLARVHAFPYSLREGTAAAKMEQVSGEVKRERMGRMLACAQDAEEKYLKKFEGKEAEVLFERDGGYTGNYIRVYCEGAEEGAMCRVRLTERYRDGMKGILCE